MNELFSAKVLKKYDVKNYQCPKCDFIQTENPYWLKEAYSSAITKLDIGLIERNNSLVTIVDWIIKIYFDYNAKFLDYAGGYGMFVRLMRDRGFDYYRQDIYCQNMFANKFDVTDLPNNPKFELVTAFEVFEHLENPVEEIEKIFQYADTVLFSTELIPDEKIKSSDDWWYFSPETGQHIAFYTPESLRLLAEKFHCKFYSNNRNLHLFTRQDIAENPFDAYDVFTNKKKNLIVKIANKISCKLEQIFESSQFKDTTLKLKNVTLKGKLMDDFEKLRKE